jgi:hypothetical protein
MIGLADKPVLLVGSVQLGSSDAVFRACAEAVGAYVPCLPDGETGPRASWVGHLAKDIYHRHADIETLRSLDLTRPPDLWAPQTSGRFAHGAAKLLTLNSVMHEMLSIHIKNLQITKSKELSRVMFVSRFAFRARGAHLYLFSTIRAIGRLWSRRTRMRFAAI